ncbi:hypothetical protein, partial [Solibacillus ferritrahens]|uniref:hypothetical protein n=1 Tax=Solibacillus ferritrahens TaxID=3098620 RepID=UPI00300ACFD5
YFIKLIGMEGDSSGNSTTPETTGSGRARGKRPGMEINFYTSKKMPFSSGRKMAFLAYVPIAFSIYPTIYCNL